MSKRAPTSALTHDNWDQEYQEEEAGSFKRANQSTLKERVIMKAKRKNLNSNGGSTATSAFAGFGAKFAAKSPEKQPESPKILAEPKGTVSLKVLGYSLYIFNCNFVIFFQ